MKLQIKFTIIVIIIIIIIKNTEYKQNNVS